MIELLKKEIAGKKSLDDKINHLREMLQFMCLKTFYDKGHFARLTFTGGTALRILYELRRFSEDLDFFLTKKSGYDFDEVASDLKRFFGLNGIEMSLKTWGLNNVDSGTMKFHELLKNVGLSRAGNIDISIELEINLDPPRGGEIKRTLVNRMFMLNIAHFSLPSLYATKLHACFFRKYVKGRDFYDLLWYISKSIKPDYTLLNNAIHQTEGEFEPLSENNLKDFLLGRLEKIDFTEVRKDVERFLEDRHELKLLNRETLEGGVRHVYGT